MKLEISRKINPNLKQYKEEELRIAYKFTGDIKKELGQFVKGVIIFGSVARKSHKPHGDIDLLVVIDDLSTNVTPEFLEAYRVLIQKIIARTSQKLHITTLRFTSFWDYLRNGDPIGVNIVRDGVALFDAGFFEPMQLLLRRGRVRPSTESIWTYFVRAPNTLHNSKWHILQATLDLYWAVIDSAHAALMQHGEVPPTPEHVSDMLNDKLVKNKLLEKHYVEVMRTFYKLSRMITHREIKEISGGQYDKYYHAAADFVQRMKSIIEPKQ